MLLLQARAPVPFRDIRDQFSAYQTAAPEAGLRAFERDKADLLALGVPMRYVTPDENPLLDDGGYIIELRKYRLPEVHLTPNEISALVLASSVARAVPSVGYAKICDFAVRKLAFDQPEPETPFSWPRQHDAKEPRHEPVLVHFPERDSDAQRLIGETFSILEKATRTRKQVTLRYQSASSENVAAVDRLLSPYGLYYRDRSWLVVGHCHLRNDLRSFRLDRIEQLSVASKPRSPDFTRPDDFDVRAYSSRSPWTFCPREKQRVVLEFESQAMNTANEDFGRDAVRELLENGNTRVHFHSGNPDYVVSRLLSSQGAIRLVEGAMCRHHLQQEIAAIGELYR